MEIENVIFNHPPAQARRMLEQIATEARRKDPSDWRVPVRAVLDAIFFVEGPMPKRRRRSRTGLCACGCGTVVKAQTGMRGRLPEYVNATHRQRAHRNRLREQNPQRIGGFGLAHEDAALGSENNHEPHPRSG